MIGKRSTIAVLATIALGSLAAGVALDYIWAFMDFPLENLPGHISEHVHEHGLLFHLSAVVFVLIELWSAIGAWVMAKLSGTAPTASCCHSSAQPAPAASGSSCCHSANPAPAPKESCCSHSEVKKDEPSCCAHEKAQEDETEHSCCSGKKPEPTPPQKSGGCCKKDKERPDDSCCGGH
jgi:hypothetical protein